MYGIYPSRCIRTLLSPTPFGHHRNWVFHAFTWWTLRTPGLLRAFKLVLHWHMSSTVVWNGRERTQESFRMAPFIPLNPALCRQLCPMHLRLWNGCYPLWITWTVLCLQCFTGALKVLGLLISQTGSLARWSLPLITVLFVAVQRKSLLNDIILFYRSTCHCANIKFTSALVWFSKYTFCMPFYLFSFYLCGHEYALSVPTMWEKSTNVILASDFLHQEISH